MPVPCEDSECLSPWLGEHVHWPSQTPLSSGDMYMMAPDHTWALKPANFYQQ